MDYRKASTQQLLAERARLANAYHKAEQRLGSGRFSSAVGSGAARRLPSSTRGPRREVDQLAEQLARVEAELSRRNEHVAQQKQAGDEESPQEAP